MVMIDFQRARIWCSCSLKDRPARRPPVAADRLALRYFKVAVVGDAGQH